MNIKKIKTTVLRNIHSQVNKWKNLDYKDKWEISINSILAFSALYVLLLTSDQIAIAKRAMQISEKSIASDLEEIKRSSEEFELLNRPFIELTDITLTPIQPNAKISISFKLINSGKFAAKILSSAHIAGYGSKIYLDTVTYPQYKVRDTINTFVGSTNSYFPISTSMTLPLTSAHYDSLLYRNWKIRLKGEIKYENAITGKKYVNKYLYELSSNGRDIIAIKNDDIPN